MFNGQLVMRRGLVSIQQCSRKLSTVTVHFAKKSPAVTSTVRGLKAFRAPGIVQTRVCDIHGTDHIHSQLSGTFRSSMDNKLTVSAGGSDADVCTSEQGDNNVGTLSEGASEGRDDSQEGPVSKGVEEPTQADKRPHCEDESGETAKRLKQDTESENKGGKPIILRKKKVAMLIVYSGQNYFGMQRNPGFVTIESDLNDAMVKAGVINEEHADAPNKMQFQRAARTDKGVSAAGQLCSLKMFVDIENSVEKINSFLPQQIKVIGIKRVTKGFDAKNNAAARTYLYLCPSFAFTPIQQIANEDYRISGQVVEEVRRILGLYKGTHNFFNFTSGKKPGDASAHRYIMDFKCSDPFVQGGMELMVLQVKGQSFMIHQIRKMIGLAISVVRGIIGDETITKAWEPVRRDIPKAPGLGLMLDKVHYDHYNERYGKDGLHEPIKWEQYEEEIDKFKQEFIFSKMIATEKEEKSMLNWLSSLHFHHFGATTFDGKERLDDSNDHLNPAFKNLDEHRKEKQAQQSASSENVKPDSESTDKQTDSDAVSESVCAKQTDTGQLATVEDADKESDKQVSSDNTDNTESVQLPAS